MPESNTSLHHAVKYFEGGNLDAATKICKSLAAGPQPVPLAVEMMGLMECQRGHLTEGVPLLEWAVRLAPQSPHFHNNLAGALGQQRKFDQALQHINIALAMDPRFGLAYVNLGVSREFQDNPRGAIEAYEKALELTPENRYIRYRIGCALHQLGRYDESEQCHLSLFQLAGEPPHNLTQYPVLQCPRVSMVVTCKGRLEHLKQTLPRFLTQTCSISFSVVVVDYGDPDGSFDWCIQQRKSNLVAIKILDNTQEFNKSRAFNCGANAVESDVICFLDADSLVEPDFLDTVVSLVSQAGVVLAKREAIDRTFDTVGVCCARATAYYAVKGYDEAHRGHGPEDIDFFARMGQIGMLKKFPAAVYPKAIRHSNADRHRFYSCAFDEPHLQSERRRRQDTSV